jgi:hypothetical protein
MKRIATVAIGLILIAGSVWAQEAKAPIETTTPGGDKIRLFPDGHWEYVDGQKAAVQRTERAVEAKKQQEAQQSPQQAVNDCPHAQGGGQIGLGRTICPGDPDYNRGSLNPKLR